MKPTRRSIVGTMVGVGGVKRIEAGPIEAAQPHLVSNPVLHPRRRMRHCRSCDPPS